MAYPQAGTAIAVDAAGVAYIAGTSIIPVAETPGPWLASWNPDGTQRWSSEGTEFGRYYTVFADTTRVIAGGATPQSNTPQLRGLIAQYDEAGAAQWSTKIVTATAITDVALAGAQTLALANAVHPWWAWELLRLDDSGSLLWSVALSPSHEDYIARVSGLAHDGEGGSWVWGERQNGPWAVRHDAQGREIDRLDCFGSTAGGLTHLAVGPAGELAVSILVTNGPIPITRAKPWVARIEDGSVVSGAVFDDGDAILRGVSLNWKPDGRLAVGIRETNPDITRMFIVP